MTIEIRQEICSVCHTKKSFRISLSACKDKASSIGVALMGPTVDGSGDNVAAIALEAYFETSESICWCKPSRQLIHLNSRWLIFQAKYT